MEKVVSSRSQTDRTTTLFYISMFPRIPSFVAFYSSTVFLLVSNSFYQTVFNSESCNRHFTHVSKQPLLFHFAHLMNVADGFCNRNNSLYNINQFLENIAVLVPMQCQCAEANED